MERLTTTYRTAGKRRPRWGRILAAVLLVALCAGGALALPRLLDAPEEIDATSFGADDQQTDAQDPGDSGGLAVSDAYTDGHVRAFSDPGVSLSGLRAGSTDASGLCADDRYAFFSLPPNAFSDAANPGGFALARFDYATRTIGWLCDVPGCDHLEPTCTAWLPLITDLFVDGEDLYLLETDLDTPAMVLYRCGLDGNDRRELVRLDGEWRLEAIAFCEEAILLVVSPIENGTVENRQQFYVYKRSDGTLQRYMTTRGCRSPYLYDDLLVASDEGMYFAIDLVSGRERELYQFTSATYVEQEGSSRDAIRHLVPPLAYRECLYYLRDKEGEYCDLVRQNIVTGEEVVLNDHVFFPDDCTAGIVRDSGLQDGCYEYCIGSLENGEDNVEYTAYCLDLATGEAVTPPPAAGQASGYPLAVFGDDCLLRRGTGAPGDPYRFYLLPWADFVAGRDTAVPVESTVS